MDPATSPSCSHPLHQAPARPPLRRRNHSPNIPSPNPTLAFSRVQSRFAPLLALLLACAASASDWTQYRGSNLDGTSTETIRTNWNANPPALLWRTQLGPGLSSVSIADNTLVLMERRRVGAQDREFCVARSLANGQQLWAVNLDLADYPNGGVGDDDGPRSTPAIRNGRVFVLGSYFQFACLDLQTGATLWHHDLPAQFGSTVIPWQNAASPVLTGDLVLINANGTAGNRILAFRQSDGSVAWRGPEDRMTHSTPALGTLAGTPQVIFFTQSGLVSLNPATGQPLWRHNLNYNGTSVAASPVVAGNTLFASRAYPGSTARAQAGAVVLDIAPAAAGLTATPRWTKINQLMNHWCSPVHIQNHVYGMFGQSSLSLQCVDLDTGNIRWSTSGFGYGSVLAVDRYLLALAESGHVALIDPTPTAYTEIARFRALDGKCWNTPALSNGRLYVRSTTDLAVYDLAPPPPPTPKPLLTQTTRQPSGSFQLVVRTEDNSPIDPTRANKIRILSTLTLAPPALSWEPLSPTAILTNGLLLYTDPNTATTPHRFFLIQESP